jgi:uncharacterized protein YciI
MEKKYFFLKLIPPRPTFSQDMTDEERNLMFQHIAYWTKIFDEGKSIIFGPVLDPKGSWGLGVAEVDDESEVKQLTSNDPVIKASLNFNYETYPMEVGKVRKFADRNRV